MPSCLHLFGVHKRKEGEGLKIVFFTKLCRYNSAIRQRDSYPAYFTTRIGKHSTFWNQKREKYHDLNEAKSHFKHGSIVKLMFQNCGVWADRRYATSQWILLQVLFEHQAYDPVNTLMITSDSSE